MKNTKDRNQFILDYNSFIEKLRSDTKSKPFDDVETEKFFLTVSEACNRLLTIG